MRKNLGYSGPKFMNIWPGKRALDFYEFYCKLRRKGLSRFQTLYGSEFVNLDVFHELIWTTGNVSKAKLDSNTSATPSRH